MSSAQKPLYLRSAPAVRRTPGARSVCGPARRVYASETLALPPILTEIGEETASIPAALEPGSYPTEVETERPAERRELQELREISMREIPELERLAQAVEGREIRRSADNACPFCATGIPAEGAGLHPKWCESDQGWHVCSVCRSVRRMGRRSAARAVADGWVVPVQFLKDRLFRFGRKRPGVLVDCSPMALLKAPGKRVFEESLTIGELEESRGWQFSELTCYSCVETSRDIEWVLDVLMQRMTPDGVLRLSLLRSPFLSAPTPLKGWGVPAVTDLQHLPSAMGFECLLARVGLRVTGRQRTTLLPIRVGSGVSGQMARILNPWSILRLAALPAMNAASLGLGEELELKRTR